MRIAFIRPSLMGERHAAVLEPRVFAILAGLSPPGAVCRLYDQSLEDVPADLAADLIAITVETHTARQAYRLAASFRQRGIPVVMGGHHPSLRPCEALHFASSVVIGDAEGVWPDVVTDARAGRLRPRYESRYPPLGPSQPDRSIFAGKRYRPLALVEYRRGCRHACDFCSVHALYGTRLRARAPGDVIAEIERAAPRFVLFTDDNLFAGPGTAEPLVDALKPLGIRWACQISVEAAADRSLVRRMAQSGCVLVTIGFESLNPTVLRQMGKAWNQGHGTYDEVVAVFRDHGIMVYGTFVFGYDHDTVDAFPATLDFALRAKLGLANFNPLTPMPGAPLYARLKRERRLIQDPWWLHPEYRYGDSAFHPRGMTARELTDGCRTARLRFHSWSSVLRRASDARANTPGWYRAGLYFALNRVSRREVRQKQGRRLCNDDPPELAEALREHGHAPDVD